MSAGEEQSDDFGLWLFYLFFCSSKVEKRTSLVRFVVRGVWPQQDNWGSGTHSLWVKNPHSTCDLGSGVTDCVSGCEEDFSEVFLLQFLGMDTFCISLVL